MYEIRVTLMDDTGMIFIGNFVLEGSFVRINHDHDNNKKTPQRTTIFPAHLIKSIECEVIQSGIR